MRRNKYFILISLIGLLLSGCMGIEDTTKPDLELNNKGLFILNEGQFNNGNASLSYYDIAGKSIKNNIFATANDQKLGDIANSMTMHNGTLWIVVNNSHVVFAVDPKTGIEKGRITGLNSPRYIHFVTDNKAYVTQMYTNEIAIVDTKKYEVTGHINTSVTTTIKTDWNGQATTPDLEQMIQIGDKLYINCWSYCSDIIEIDTKTDTETRKLNVGIQPNSMTLDKDGMLWVLTDGSYGAMEAAALHKIDPAKMQEIKKIELAPGKGFGWSDLKADAKGENLYLLNKALYKFPINEAVQLNKKSTTTEPTAPKAFIELNESIYTYGIDPNNGEFYLGEGAFDKNAWVFRYSADGTTLIDKVKAGVSPKYYIWY